MNDAQLGMMQMLFGVHASLGKKNSKNKIKFWKGVKESTDAMREYCQRFGLFGDDTLYSKSQVDRMGLDLSLAHRAAREVSAVPRIELAPSS